jgi:hypothetical protein
MAGVHRMCQMCPPNAQRMSVSSTAYGAWCQMWPPYPRRSCPPANHQHSEISRRRPTPSIDPKENKSTVIRSALFAGQSTGHRSQITYFTLWFQTYGTSCTFLRNAFHFTAGSGGQKFSWINKGCMTAYWYVISLYIKKAPGLTPIDKLTGLQHVSSRQTFCVEL